MDEYQGNAFFFDRKKCIPWLMFLEGYELRRGGNQTGARKNFGCNGTGFENEAGAG